MALGLICGIVVIIGAIMINSADPSKVKTGSILVLVFFDHQSYLRRWILRRCDLGNSGWYTRTRLETVGLI